MSFCFIVGCARSGTSVLGELIASNHEVNYVFEAHPIWELGGLGINESHRLTADHANPDIKEQIRNWFDAQLGESSILVEKNPRNILRIPYVKEIFPEAKYIHIVRDGRDVACSMVPGCGGNEWRHLKPPSWKMFFDSYNGAIRCALAWKQILEIGLQDLKTVPHLQIHYEDLVLSPKQIANTIMSYLNLSLDESVKKFCELIENTTFNSYHAQYQDRWYRDNHHVRIGRWHENLSDHEKKTINEMLSPLLDKLGYPIA